MSVVPLIRTTVIVPQQQSTSAVVALAGSNVVVRPLSPSTRHTVRFHEGSHHSPQLSIHMSPPLSLRASPHASARPSPQHSPRNSIAIAAQQTPMNYRSAEHHQSSEQYRHRRELSDGGSSMSGTMSATLRLRIHLLLMHDLLILLFTKIMSLTTNMSHLRLLSIPLVLFDLACMSGAATAAILTSSSECPLIDTNASSAVQTLMSFRFILLLYAVRFAVNAMIGLFRAYFTDLWSMDVAHMTWARRSFNLVQWTVSIFTLFVFVLANVAYMNEVNINSCDLALAYSILILILFDYGLMTVVIMVILLFTIAFFSFERRTIVLPFTPFTVNVVAEARRAAVEAMVGVSPTVLSTLPVLHYRSGQFNESERQCSICLVDMAEGDAIRILTCAHHFHSSCVDEWLTRRMTCPNCNATQRIDDKSRAVSREQSHNYRERDLPYGGESRQDGHAYGAVHRSEV